MKNLDKISGYDNYRFISLDSGNDGPIVCIVGGVHGNESCGINAIFELEELFKANKLHLCKGKILTLIANLRAFRNNERFIDVDLNRSFNSSTELEYEYQLANSIKPHLNGLDYLLDLHSTSAHTQPFCAGILTNRHCDYFRMTGLNFYTYGWERHRGHNMLIDEVNRLGGIGMIVECGKNDSLNANKVATSVIIRTLHHLDMILGQDTILELTLDDSNLRREIIEVAHVVNAQSNDFSFVRPFHNFEKIQKNQVIAYDCGQVISHPYSYVLLMPNMQGVQKDDEVFGIGFVRDILHE